MGYCKAFLFSASGVISWTPDRDIVVNALAKSSNTIAALISTDPNLTVAQVSSAPTVTGISDDVVLFVPASQVNNTGLKLNLLKDQKLFITFGAAGGLFLFVEDILT